MMNGEGGERPVTAPDVFRCGGCARAYGFCLKGADGGPVCCRCSLDDCYLRMCNGRACRSYVDRGTPVPETFPFGVSERRDGGGPAV